MKGHVKKRGDRYWRFGSERGVGGPPVAAQGL